MSSNNSKEAAKWAENCQSKKAFIDNLEHQSPKWKVFVIWMFVLGARVAVENQYTSDLFLKEMILEPIFKQNYMDPSFIKGI